MFLEGRVQIVPIEVLAPGVEPIVAPIDTVRVEHGDDLEHKALSQDARLLTLLIQKEVEDPIQHEGTRGFSRMDPACQEYSRLVDDLRTLRLISLMEWEEVGYQLLVLILYLIVPACEGPKLHGPLL